MDPYAEPAASADDPPPPPGGGSAVKGFFVAIAVHGGLLLLLLPICALGGVAGEAVLMLGVWLLAGFGLIQFIPIIPLMLYYRRRDEPRTVAGLALCAGLVLLLSGGCTAMIFVG